MSRLRYGPRFSQHGATTKYSVSEHSTDRQEKADRAKMAAIVDNLPLYRKELAHHKAGVGIKKTIRKKSGATKDERLVAERRMLEAMRKAVSILEFHMEELHRTRKIGNGKSLVNQYGIHNALVQLRTKCGVYFEQNEYDHHVDLAQLHLERSKEQWLDEVRADREQQRLSRLRNMRAMAEKFITKHRNSQ